MCGNGKCIYYGCANCLRYMKDPVAIVRREECDCTNEIFDECCDAKCAVEHMMKYEDHERNCVLRPEFSLSYGPSTL